MGASLETVRWRSLKDLTSEELSWKPGPLTTLALLLQVSPNIMHLIAFASLTTAAALELCCWSLCVQFQGKRTVTMTVQPALPGPAVCGMLF